MSKEKTLIGKLKTASMWWVVAAIIGFGIVISPTLIFLGLRETIFVLIISILLTLLTFLLMRKQKRESDKLKAGDVVFISGLTNDGEILEVDDTHAIIKTRVSKMKLSIKK